MSIRSTLCVAAFLSIFVPCHALAIPLANSQTEFSSTQGGDGWFYGFYNRTADASLPYGTGDFVQFANYDVSLPPPTWRADLAQVNTLPTIVGTFNATYLGVDAVGGHPTGPGPDDQDAVVWAIRRYISEAAGLIDISIDVHKINTSSGSNGITARVFVDGNEIYTKVIAGTDGVGIQATLLATVAVGSIIDFAIDPTGTGPIPANSDGIESARSDGSHFSALIGTHEAPLPATPALVAAGLALIAVLRRRPRGAARA